MPRVAVVTDSNSGISVEEGRKLGVAVVPMPVLIDGKIYYEGEDLTQEQFYEKQLSGSDIATSQPAPGDVMAVWDRVLERCVPVCFDGDSLRREKTAERVMRMRALLTPDGPAAD